MIEGRRAREIFRRAQYTMQKLASISSTSPVNQQVRLDALCSIWGFKRAYITESYSYSVSQKAYNADLSKITALEGKVVQGGAYEREALEAIKEAREYLRLVAGYRVRDNRKTRVY